MLYVIATLLLILVLAIQPARELLLMLLAGALVLAVVGALLLAVFRGGKWLFKISNQFSQWQDKQRQKGRAPK